MDTFVATTFTRQSGGQPRNVLYKYVVAVKKEGNTIGHLQELFIDFARCL